MNYSAEIRGLMVEEHKFHVAAETHKKECGRDREYLLFRIERDQVAYQADETRRQAVRIRRSQWLALDQASIPCARAGARREFIEVERQADGFRLVRLTEAGIEALDRASRSKAGASGIAGAGLRVE